MNEFEKYLKDNKEKIELDGVRNEVWTKIENQALKKSQTKATRLLKLVSIAAIFMLGIIIYQFNQPHKAMEISSELLAQYGLDQINDIDKSLNSKMQMIRQTPVSKGHINDLQLLLDQTVLLDKLYQDKTNKLSNENQDELKAKVLLEYYKSKSELLEKVLSEINKINKNEKEYQIENEKLLLSF